jgi:hypothetical protein
MAPGEEFIGPASDGVHTWRVLTPALVSKRRLAASLRKAAASAVIRRERRGDGRVETTNRRLCC